MNVKTMDSTGITKERVLAQLRSEQLLHLGEVNKLYLEADGKFTLLKSNDVKAIGLPVVPDVNNDFPQLKKSDQVACEKCGYIDKNQGKNFVCPSCGNTHSVYAVFVESDQQ